MVTSLQPTAHSPPSSPSRTHHCRRALSHPQPVRQVRHFTLLPSYPFQPNHFTLLPLTVLLSYTRLSLSLVGNPIFPIYRTTTTTLSLHTVNTRTIETSKNSLSTTQNTPIYYHYAHIHYKSHNTPYSPNPYTAPGEICLLSIGAQSKTCCTSAPPANPPRDLRQSHCSKPR